MEQIVSGPGYASGLLEGVVPVLQDGLQEVELLLVGREGIHGWNALCASQKLMIIPCHFRVTC